MESGMLGLLFLSVVAVVTGLTPVSFLTPTDKARLQSVFEAAKPYQIASSCHYSLLGLKLLGVPIANEKEVCATLEPHIGSTLESLFHISAASKSLAKCQFALLDETVTLFTDAIKPESPVIDIFYAFFAAKNFGFPVNDKKVKTALLEALKKDDSPLSYGYAFHVASRLGGDVTQFYDSIEDIVAQADEVDDKYLQFEGGLFITSVIIDGAYKLATTAKKMPTISDNKVLKFANYLLGRKNIQQLRSAYYLLSALNTLANVKFYTAIAVNLASPVSVTEKNPNVQVRVTNLMGGNLGALEVTAENARHLGDDAVVVSKKKFTPSSTDKSLFELNLLEAKPARGFYRIEISVQRGGATTRLLGNTGAIVQVKVTTQVSIENVEIGVGDADQTTPPTTTSLQHPNKAANILEADYHQKIILKFKLKDKTSGKLMTAHQAFVRMVNKATGQEIIFVAEADSVLVNVFEMDVGSKGKEFGYLSGLYTMQLIVGDAAIENPVSWTVADVKLSFPEELEVTKKKEGSIYAKKPEIKHMFREQEKRPSVTVSTAFTVLVLLPLLILVALWARLGVNASNFPASFSAVAFHTCLAAIFVLYVLYWTSLNMFETLRYLAVLAVPTFLFGNRLLSFIAAKKK